MIYLICTLVGIGIGWYGCNKHAVIKVNKSLLDKYQEENNDKEK